MEMIIILIIIIIIIIIITIIMTLINDHWSLLEAHWVIIMLLMKISWGATEWWSNMTISILAITVISEATSFLYRKGQPCTRHQVSGIFKGVLSPSKWKSGSTDNDSTMTITFALIHYHIDHGNGDCDNHLMKRWRGWWRDCQPINM